MSPVDDMTPAELNRAVAEEIFDATTQGDCWWIVGPIKDGIPSFVAEKKHDFRPADDETCLHWAVKAANLVCDKYEMCWICHRGIKSQHDDSYNANLYEPIFPCEGGEPLEGDSWEVSAAIPGEAICRAALKAKRAKGERDE